MTNSLKNIWQNVFNKGKLLNFSIFKCQNTKLEQSKGLLFNMDSQLPNLVLRKDIISSQAWVGCW